jgi:hypothetical protein
MSIPLTIESLYGGGAVERLHGALHEALQNILDPNTPAKKPRKVKLELTIRPNEKRDMAELLVTTSTTLCPPAPLETSIFIDKDRDGRAHASERAAGENPGQASFPDVLTKGKITNFKKEGTNA